MEKNYKSFAKKRCVNPGEKIKPNLQQNLRKF